MWGAGNGPAPAIMKQNASTRATTSSAHATPRRHPARSLDSWSHPVRSSSGESHRVRARRWSLATGPGIQTGRRDVAKADAALLLLRHRVVPGAL